MSAKAVSTEKLNLKFARKAQKIERKIRKLESKLAGIALKHASINLPSKSKPKKIPVLDSSDYEEDFDLEEELEEEEELAPENEIPIVVPVDAEEEELEEEDLEEDFEEEDTLDEPESTIIPGVSVDATSVPSSVIVHVDPNEETSVDATSAPASVIIHVDPRDIPRPETPFNSSLERRMDDLEYSVTELRRNVTSINEMFSEFFDEWKKCGRILRKPAYDKTLPSGKPHPFVYREDPALTGDSNVADPDQQEQLTEWDMPDAERW